MQTSVHTLAFGTGLATPLVVLLAGWCKRNGYTFSEEEYTAMGALIAGGAAYGLILGCAMVRLAVVAACKILACNPVEILPPPSPAAEKPQS